VFIAAVGTVLDPCIHCGKRKESSSACFHGLSNVIHVTGSKKHFFAFFLSFFAPSKFTVPCYYRLSVLTYSA
jgi:hypothetical protein